MFLPNWIEIFRQEGLKPLIHGRGPCPFCQSKTGFSASEEKHGVFFCFACGRKGNKVAFIQQLHETDWKTAFAYFGSPGLPPRSQPGPYSPQNYDKPGNPSKSRKFSDKQRLNFEIQASLNAVEQTGARAAKKIMQIAEQRLEADPDDKTAWKLIEEILSWNITIQVT